MAAGGTSAPATAPSRFATLAEDAVASIDEMELVRLQSGWTDVGGDAARSEYVYIFRNRGARPHHVVALNAMNRGVQFNMKVRDKDDKRLIYLDSAFCAAASRGYALGKLRGIRAILKKYESAAKFEFGLTEADIERAFMRASLDPKEEARQAKAVEKAIGEVSALYASLPVNYLQAYRDRDGIYAGLQADVQAFVQDVGQLEKLLTELLAFLEDHQGTYVPFVLLEKAIAPASGEEPTSLAMVKHSVQAQDPRWHDRLLHLLAVVLFLPLVVLEKACQALGLHVDRVRFELSTRATSTHYPIVLSQGMYHLGAFCKNLPARFLRDHQGDQWAKSAAGSFYFYRQKAQVSAYQSLGVHSLRLLLFSRESLSAMVLLYLALVTAYLWGGDGYEPDVDKAIVGLTIASSLAYVAFSHGKPKFQDTVWTKALAIAALLFRSELADLAAGPLAWATHHAWVFAAWLVLSFAASWAWTARTRLQALAEQGVRIGGRKRGAVT